jgi:flagellar FliJ protein
MQTLLLLLEREEAERDQALLRLQHAEDEARRAQSQAETLLAYREEYRQRWSAQFARGGSMPVVQCYQGFMARLEQAIVQQQRQVDAAQQRADQCRAALAAQQLRVASVRKLVERRQRDQQQRREQKTTDETAARAHRHAQALAATAALPSGA